MKFTAEEARSINLEARANVAGARADMQRWRAEQHQRDSGDRIVIKTVDHARAAEPAPAQQTTMDAQTAAWVEWVDRRIAHEIGDLSATIAEALDQLVDNQHASVQQALDRRDAAIQALRDEVDIKISLGRKLARLKAEVAEARQQAPNFKAELARLQEEAEKQQRTIVRLRAQNSTLEYQQKLMDAELLNMKRNSAASGAAVQFETSSSRITVGNLHPDAASALRQFASEVVDAYDGDPILFSGPAGTA